jgi:hypothetical protein
VPQVPDAKGHKEDCQLQALSGKAKDPFSTFGPQLWIRRLVSRLRRSKMGNKKKKKGTDWRSGNSGKRNLEALKP